jgi:hypothetical protein
MIYEVNFGKNFINRLQIKFSSLKLYFFLEKQLNN